ncbi:MAG TPA: rod shape-determining protein RodA [Acidimicrobiia bacterium]|nr:rod shape-determining protein RodA [Acidimicrobiia bacterium]
MTEARRWPLVAVPDAPPAIGERRRNRPDRVLLITLLAISLLGLVMIYSATRVGLERSDLPASFSMERQMIFVAAGLIAYLAASLFDYRELRHLFPGLYAGMLVLLLAVFLFPAVKGAQRWIDLSFFQLQPSEFSKTVCVIALAAVLGRPQAHLSWGRIFLSLGVVAIPGALIFLQPDLGTMLVFGFMTLVMLFAAGMSARQLLLVTGAGGFLGTVVVQQGWLLGYQLDRIRVLFQPDLDPTGIGWNLRQSKLAVGSGQLFGKGLFEGQQTNFQYVPEQGTDFIFTAVGEQLGFVGGILVITAYLVLIWRLLAIAAAARDRFGALIALGVASMLMFHVFINVGMTIGIMPVTGLPLPFMSAGGSSFVNFALALGIANSVWLRRSRVPSEISY